MLVNMSSDLRMQNTSIDCYNMRKNEMFVIIDSLFNEGIDYCIELLFVFRSRLSRVDNKAVSHDAISCQNSFQIH